MKTTRKKPDTLDVASLVMREVNRRGGSCEILELREAVTRQVAPSWTWRRSFTHTYDWAIVILTDLGELERVDSADGGSRVVCYRLASDWDPRRDSMRRSRREARLAHYVERDRKNWD